MKRGRFSDYDMQYIRDNAFSMDYKSIAGQLDREPKSVKIWIEANMKVKVDLGNDGRPIVPQIRELRQKKFWPLLEQQLSADELSFFEYQWDMIIGQFKNDVLPTEEVQIVDMIKIDILMNRNMVNSREYSLDLKKISDDLDLERDKPSDKTPPEGQDHKKVAQLQGTLGVLRTTQVNLTKEYKDLHGEKDKVMKALKATRSDRVKRIESSRENVLTWFAEIITDKELRRELGNRAEKMRLATIDEEIRLAAYHKYEDGLIDQPLLNCDTVKDDNGSILMEVDKK